MMRSMSSETGKKGDGVVSSQASELSFEAMMEKLTSTVETLENGDLSLEDSLLHFETGVKLTKLAQAKLDDAEKRIEKLLAVRDDGSAETADFALRDVGPAASSKRG